MDFFSLQAMVLGGVALGMMGVVVWPKKTSRPNKIIGSLGFISIAIGFFILARSHELRLLGSWYHPYADSAKALLQVTMGLSAIGVPCLCWWIIATRRR